MSNLPTLLFIALTVMFCSGHLIRDSKDIMGRRHCTWLGCQPSYLKSRNRLARSLPEEQPDTKVIFSDQPTERILEEVNSKYVANDEYAEIIQDENQEVGRIRHKRGVRITVIKICNRRTKICRIIVVRRRY